MRKQECDSTAAQNRLLEVLKPGDTVYTVLRSVSRSGMQRTIDMIVFKDGSPRWIGYAAAQVVGECCQDACNGYMTGHGVIVKGCGMDMGADLVRRLSDALFGDACQLKNRWL